VSSKKIGLGNSIRSNEMNEGTSITPKTVGKSTVTYPTPLGGSIDKLKAQKLIANPGYKKGLALHGFLKKPRYASLTVVK
jgi:hypothetical protein